MKVGTEGPRPADQAPTTVHTPARAAEEALAVARGSDDPYAALAVRALGLLVLGVGGLLALLALVQRIQGPLSLLGQSRALIAGCLVVGGSGALALARAGFQRASATLSLS